MKTKTPKKLSSQAYVVIALSVVAMVMAFVFDKVSFTFENGRIKIGFVGEQSKSDRGTGVPPLKGGAKSGSSPTKPPETTAAATSSNAVINSQKDVTQSPMITNSGGETTVNYGK